MKNRYLLVSLALHVMVFFLAILSVTSGPKMDEKVTVDFELKQEAKKIGTQAKLNTNLKKNLMSHKALAQKLLTEGFSPRGKEVIAGASRRQREGAWEENGFSTEDDPNIAWGAGGGTFERVQELVLMSRFHEIVDGYLFYPGVLARQKIKGVVNTRIVLNIEGSCDWSLTKITSNDAYLRFFILHLIKKVCDGNYKKYIGDRISTNVDMTFEFSISEQPTTQELIRKNQKVLGNVLFFFRNSQQSIAEWHLGPFTGMFPIPMVNLDFDWIVDNFDRYVNHKDSMKEYRD